MLDCSQEWLDRCGWSTGAAGCRWSSRCPLADYPDDLELWRLTCWKLGSWRQSIRAYRTKLCLWESFSTGRTHRPSRCLNWPLRERKRDPEFRGHLLPPSAARLQQPQASVPIMLATCNLHAVRTAPVTRIRRKDSICNWDSYESFDNLYQCERSAFYQPAGPKARNTQRSSNRGPVTHPSTSRNWLMAATAAGGSS